MTSAGYTIHRDRHQHGSDNSNAAVLAARHGLTPEPARRPRGVPAERRVGEIADPSNGLVSLYPERGSGMNKRFAAAVLAAVLVSACANLDVDRAADDFDETAYASDLSECRGGPAALFALNGLEGALLGSAYGLVEGVRIGASAGDAGEGAVIGVIVGGVMGFGFGAYDSIGQHDEALRHCLRDKGYETNPV